MTSDLATRLRSARTFDEIEAVTLAAARGLAGADGATFVLRDGEHVFYVGEDAVAPLWRGQRFPIDSCVSGWAMTHRQPAQIRDIELDERVPLDAYRPTFVRSLVMVPMGTVAPVGAVGVYWAARGRTLPHATLAALLTLAAEAGDAVSRLGLHAAPWAPNFALRDDPTSPQRAQTA